MCLSYRLFSSHHYKCIRRRALEEKTLECFWGAKMAGHDATGAGKPSCWSPILTQWPNRKVLVLERLSTSHKSASNITYSAIASRKRSACVLRTVQHAVSTYSLVRPPVQCSVLCMPRCFTTPHHLHNTNASRVLLPQCRDASAVVKLWVVGKCCHTSCTPCTMHGIVRVVPSHCAFSPSLVDFTCTIRSTSRSQHLHVSWVHACMYDPTWDIDAYLSSKVMQSKIQGCVVQPQQCGLWRMLKSILNWYRRPSNDGVLKSWRKVGIVCYP